MQPAAQQQAGIYAFCRVAIAQARSSSRRCIPCLLRLKLEALFPTRYDRMRAAHPDQAMSFPTLISLSGAWQQAEGCSDGFAKQQMLVSAGGGPCPACSAA